MDATPTLPVVMTVRYLTADGGAAEATFSIREHGDLFAATITRLGGGMVYDIITIPAKGG